MLAAVRQLESRGLPSHGTMMDLPKGWPMFCLDLKQMAVMAGNPKLPPDPGDAHNALADAIWTKEAWEYVRALPAPAPDGREA